MTLCETLLFLPPSFLSHILLNEPNLLSHRMSTQEHFPTVKHIKYEGPESKNALAYRYYNAEEVILGKKMKDHLRFAVSLWCLFVVTCNNNNLFVFMRVWMLYIN